MDFEGASAIRRPRSACLEPTSVPDCFSEYEIYRTKLTEDLDAKNKVAYAQQTRCILVEERSLLPAARARRIAGIPHDRKPVRALAMWIVAVELAIVFAGSTLPTPPYLLYRRAFEFSEVTLTLIYAVYVAGNVAALFIFGRLSDQIGRRKTTLSALGVAAISTVAFAFAGSTSWLFAARLLSGFAIGLAAGTATAWIAELHPQGDKAAAAMVAAAANLAGLGLGALMAGLFAQYGPWPLQLAYMVYLAMLAAIGVAVWSSARETVENAVQHLMDVSLRPRLGVPRDSRSKFLSPAVTAFGIFSLIGFYSALAPSLLTESLHQSSAAVSGSVVFELFIIAAVSMVAMRTLKSRTAMLSGLALLLPSLALLIIAQAAPSMPLLILATALSGISAALGYRGSLEVVNQISPVEKRSEVVSSYFIACFAGNSVPVVGIGLISQIASSMTAHLIFAVVIGTFAVVGLVTGVKYAPKQ